MDSMHNRKSTQKNDILSLEQNIQLYKAKVGDKLDVILLQKKDGSYIVSSYKKYLTHLSTLADEDKIFSEVIVKNQPSKLYLVIEYDRMKNSDELSNDESSRPSCFSADNRIFKQFLLVFNEYLTKKLDFKVSFDMCFILDGSDKQTYYKQVIYNLVKDKKEYVFKDNESVKKFVYDFDLQFMTFINSACNISSFNPMFHTASLEDIACSTRELESLDNLKKNSTTLSETNISGASLEKKFLGKFGLKLCKNFLITDQITRRTSLFINSKVYNDNQRIPLLLTKRTNPPSDSILDVCPVSDVTTELIGKGKSYEKFYKLSRISASASNENIEIIDVKLSPLFLLLQNKIDKKDIRNVADLNKEMHLAQRSVPAECFTSKNLKNDCTNFSAAQVGSSDKNLDNKDVQPINTYDDTLSEKTKSSSTVGKVLPFNFQRSEHKNSPLSEMNLDLNPSTKLEEKISTADLSNFKGVEDRKADHVSNKQVLVPSLKTFFNSVTNIVRDESKDIVAEGLFCYHVWIKENCKIVKDAEDNKADLNTSMSALNELEDLGDIIFDDFNYDFSKTSAGLDETSLNPNKRRLSISPDTNRSSCCKEIKSFR